MNKVVRPNRFTRYTPRFAAILIAFSLVFAFTACKSNNEESTSANTENTTTQSLQTEGQTAPDISTETDEENITASDITGFETNVPIEDTTADDTEYVTDIITESLTTKPKPPVTTKKPIVTTPAEDTTVPVEDSESIEDSDEIADSDIIEDSEIPEDSDFIEDSDDIADSDDIVDSEEDTTQPPDTEPEVPNIQGMECTEKQLEFYNKSQDLFSVMLLNNKEIEAEASICKVEYLEWRAGVQTFSKFTAVNPATGETEECYRLRVQAEYFYEYSVFETICEIPVFLTEFDAFVENYNAIPRAEKTYKKVDKDMYYTSDMFVQMSDAEAQVWTDLFTSIIDNFPA